MKEIISSNYSILIGKESLLHIDTSKYSNVAILVDENSKKFCLDKLPKIKNAITIELNSGENYKNLSSCDFIWQQLVKHEFDRKSLMLNLGGGFIGDIGGFCASTYKRGIDFIHIPTTLLSMVDASIGGKTGVNFNNIKNLVGVFNNPKSILINPEFLKTLNDQELKSGFAEVVKHALIYDLSLWNQITSTKFEDFNWEGIIAQSIQIKNKIILQDPLEKGERKKLNFGHTYGHAIESYYIDQGIPILHGEAIFIGMILETDISFLSEKKKDEIKNFIIKNFKLPQIPKKSELIKYMRNDKKNSSKKINFSLLTNIGESKIDNLFLEHEL
ncbi:MAG: 3-dehydroquinate synthase [Flavobacteriales bacterium]|nr:3-dehydroquinate synthase [Flavobacteriales bacterium]